MRRLRADLAEDWAERHGCERAYADYPTMLREHELDGVLLATWPNLHREQVLGCLEAGVRAILCEKALALSGADARELRSAATAAGALVVEGYMYRRPPGDRQGGRAARRRGDRRGRQRPGRLQPLRPRGERAGRPRTGLAAAAGARRRRALRHRLLLRRRLQSLRGCPPLRVAGPRELERSLRTRWPGCSGCSSTAAASSG